MIDPTPTASPTTGQRIAERYELEQLIGSGATATVWSGTDHTLNRAVAVKVLHRHLVNDPTALERFRTEGRLAAQVAHRNVAAVYDTVSGPECEAIVMEYVEGTTLRDVLSEHGRLGPRPAVEIGLQILEGLEETHRHGLVHGDLKPSNLLVTEDHVVKLTDFGTAQSSTASALPDVDLTHTDSFAGTATYLSPEHLMAQPLEARSDLFSAGVVMYEVLCGRPPFTATTEVARALQRLHHSPLAPHQVVPGIPKALSRWVMHMLALMPQDRPPDAAAARALLADCLDPTEPGVPIVNPAPTAAPWRKARTRRAEPSGRAVAPPNRRTAARQRAGQRPRSTRQRHLGTLFVGSLIALSMLLIWALVRQDPDTSGLINPPTQHVGPVSAMVSTFDPGGTGVPGENDGQVIALVDGTTATQWSTERYESADFGTKQGVGVQLALADATTLDRLAWSNATTGWSATVYVSDQPFTAIPSGATAAQGTNLPDHGSFELGDTSGRFILLWITELSPVANRFQVSIGELSVFGRL